VKLRSKTAFGLSLPFLFFFLLGITHKGQEVLRGKLPPNAEHWKVDDIYMGAGIAPFAWGLFPFLLLVIVGLGLLFLDRRRISH
jgi:hypothetical protein